MTTTFSSILDESPDEVVRPKPLPVGTYLCRVQGPVKYGKSDKKGTEFSEFALIPIDALDDVDADDVESAGGLDGKSLRITFWHTEDSIYRLDEFHEHCGISLDDGRSRRARNDECVNAEVLATVKHTQSDDNTRVFTNVSRTAAP